MLSQKMNESLTRVGPDTPAGKLLRRYWLPVSAEADFTAEKPIKKVRVLGEDLVLFRDGAGNFGLLEEHCCHRSASLYYGFVEDDGLRCPYHGWKFDCSGACIEQPFEPANSPLKKEARQLSYPVQAADGIVFAYLGPAPAPLLPRWDVLSRTDGVHKIFVLPVLNCNWLQVMENSVDPTHTYYLHAHTFTTKKGNPNRGAYYYRPIEKVSFEIVKEDNWCGVRKQRFYGGDNGEAERGHPLLFPNMLLSPQREHLVMHMRLPIDDTHTVVFRHQFTPNADGAIEPQPDIVPVQHEQSFRDEDGEYHMNSFASQDAMAWETQGAITNRTRETLGVSDGGVVLLRKLLREQIKKVEQGQDPHGVIRDPAKAGPIKIDVSEGQVRMAREMAKT
ncbi:MAG TPA: Rieske 2Fe-2S domain-containing protein [Alphaproteobacteria bacterium]|jgi:5,5'-dehydrodivanillate O-demethylase